MFHWSAFHWYDWVLFGAVVLWAGAVIRGLAELCGLLKLTNDLLMQIQKGADFD
jgi:hypothetical protein